MQQFLWWVHWHQGSITESVWIWGWNTFTCKHYIDSFIKSDLQILPLSPLPLSLPPPSLPLCVQSRLSAVSDPVTTTMVCWRSAWNVLRFVADTLHNVPTTVSVSTACNTTHEHEYYYTRKSNSKAALFYPGETKSVFFLSPAPGPATSPLLTSKPLRVTSHLPTSSDLSTPVLAESPTLLLYSLLALSLLLLFSSLSIALTVILRRYRTKASHLAVKTVKQNHRRHKQHGEEVGRSPGKAIQTSRGKTVFFFLNWGFTFSSTVWADLKVFLLLYRQNLSLFNLNFLFFRLTSGFF